MRHNTPFLRFATLFSLLFVAFSALATAQTDVTRESIAITYPLDQTVKVRLKGTTIQPSFFSLASIRFFLVIHSLSQGIRRTRTVADGAFSLRPRRDTRR